MRYASIDDLIERFGATEVAQLASDDGRVTPELIVGLLTDAPNDADPDAVAAARRGLARVEAAIGDAEEIVDAKLYDRYRLPLNERPKVLTRLVCQIVRFDLYDDNAPDEVTERKKDALRLLDQIANRTASLGLPENDQTASAGAPDFVSGHRVFTRDTFRGY